MALGGNVVAAGKVLLRADTSDLKRGLAEARRDFDRTGKTMSTALKVGAAAAAAGAGLLAVGLKKSIDAAVDAEKSQKKLEAQLKALGLSYKEYGKRIDEVIQKQSKLSAFDDEDLAESFTNLVRTTGNVNEALKLNATAADLARAKNISLEAASKLIIRAYNGSEKSLSRLGIVTEKYTVNQDKLKAKIDRVKDALKDAEGAEKTQLEAQLKALEAEKKRAQQLDQLGQRQENLVALQRAVAGQAEEYGKTAAGAQERLGVAVENLMEKVGQGLLPIVTKVVNKVTDWVTALTESERAHSILKGAVEGVKTVFGGVVDVVRRAIGFFKEHEGAAKALAIAIGGVATAAAGMKVLNFAAKITGISSVLGLLGRLSGALTTIGTGQAAAGVGGLAGKLAELTSKGGKIGGIVGGLSRIAGIALGPWGLAAAAGVGGLAFAITKLIDSGPSRAEKALEDLNEIAKDLAPNLRQIADASLTLSGAQLSVERATLDVERAEQNLKQVRKDAGRDSLEYKEAELALREAKQRLREAIAAETDAEKNLKSERDEQARMTLNANRAIEELLQGTREETAAAREAANAAGRFASEQDKTRLANERIGPILRERVSDLREMAEKYGGTKTQAGRAALAIAEFIEKTGRVPNKTETKVLLHGAKNAKSDLETIINYLNTADGKRVTATIEVLLEQRGNLVFGPTNTLPARQEGGIIPMLPGTTWGRDGVLIMAAPGEVVVPADTVAAMGRDFWASLGIPGFQTGGQVGGIAIGVTPSPGPGGNASQPGSPSAPSNAAAKPKTRYGTFWQGARNRFFSPVDEDTFWAYIPGGQKHKVDGRKTPSTDGLPHVGPTGDKMKGRPLQFPYWGDWWGPGEGVKFMREWAKRNRKRPEVFREQFVEKHPLAAKLLGLVGDKVPRHRWPWRQVPEPEPGGRGSLESPPSDLGGVPRSVAAAYAEAARLARLNGPYPGVGAGHGVTPPSYPGDCSAMVSRVLMAGGFIRYGPAFGSWHFKPGGGSGLVPGRGKWITVYATGGYGAEGHVGMGFWNGQRFESSGTYGIGWTPRTFSGYSMTHPRGYQRGGIIGRYARGGIVRRFPTSQSAPKAGKPPKKGLKAKAKDVARLQRKIDAKHKAIEREAKAYDDAVTRYDSSVEEFTVFSEEGGETIDQAAIDQRASELEDLIRRKDKIVQMIRDLQAMIRQMVELLVELRGMYQRKIEDWESNLKKAVDPEVRAALQKKIDDARKHLKDVKEDIPEARETRRQLAEDIKGHLSDADELRSELAEVRGTTVESSSPGDGGGESFSDGGGGDFGGGDAGSTAQDAAQALEDARQRLQALKDYKKGLLTGVLGNLFDESILGDTGHILGSSLLDELPAQMVVAAQGGTTGSAGPATRKRTREEIIQELLALRRAQGGTANLPHQFGRPPVTIIQNFSRPPDDHFHWLQRARAAAEFAR
jgi:uncharacterized membrane protein YgcG